jgi:tetratricopeptide (TPR) repeat protein
LVQAGALADRSRLEEAIELLATAAKKGDIRRPKDHHLRTWYALADLYERAGEVPRARELFRRVKELDVDEVYDAAERLDGIG